MLSSHLENTHADVFTDALEEEEARYANVKQEYRTRINAIVAKKEDLIMQRGAEAIKYAVSILTAFTRLPLTLFRHLPVAFANYMSTF